MMKNTEWGAVAYLQHSEYGSHASIRINNNSDFKTGYSSVNEPTCGYTNDNRDCNKYGTTADVTLAYNTETGYLASTTGNISGIYDMSGGAWEDVMSIMTDQGGNPLSGLNATYNSGFTGGYSEGNALTSGYAWPDSKYYEKYAYSNTTNRDQYQRRILGDATGEIGPFKTIIYANNISLNISSWYADYSHFVYTTYPWFSRSGAYNFESESGMFAFAATRGEIQANHSFRVVLTPQ